MSQYSHTLKKHFTEELSQFNFSVIFYKPQKNSHCSFEVIWAQ